MLRTLYSSVFTLHTLFNSISIKASNQKKKNNNHIIYTRCEYTSLITHTYIFKLYFNTIIIKVLTKKKQKKNEQCVKERQKCHIKLIASYRISYIKEITVTLIHFSFHLIAFAVLVILSSVALFLFVFFTWVIQFDYITHI